MKASRAFLAASTAAIALAAAPITANAQQTSYSGMPGMPGMSALPTQDGTWVYPIRPGMHEAMLANETIGTANGIDGDFLARSSLQAVFTQAGDAPTCDGSSRTDMRGRSRIIAMQVWTNDAPYMSGTQESRIIINQELERAVVYLHGDTVEWVPGPNFCDDGQYVRAGGGRGSLRMEYETTAHIAPLNFMAFPHPSTVDMEAYENACRMFEDNMLTAYQDLHQRWSTIPITHDMPIDWSVITPFSDGYNDGDTASFGDGLFNTRDVIDAASQARDAIGMGQAIGEFFAHAPTLAGGAGGVATWALGQVVDSVATNVFVDPAEAMMMIAQAGDAAYRSSGEPSARAVHEHAQQRRPHPSGHELSGLNVDYVVHTVLDACQNLDEIEMTGGDAYGYFSWPGGTAVLTGRALAPGAPAATAAGPVQSGSIANALALAQLMGATNIPSLEELGAQMPEGYSLEHQPAPMTGQAGGGGLIAAGAPEWFVSYNVELSTEGERIAELWFDPRR
tara:strand:+ start:1029 stop:2549 length:1521 start_codon:yes stop_codon:yes gene_type:complete